MQIGTVQQLIYLYCILLDGFFHQICECSFYIISQEHIFCFLSFPFYRANIMETQCILSCIHETQKNLCTRYYIQ